MWTTRTEKLTANRAMRIALERDSASLPYGEVLELWAHDQDFRSWFIDLLANVPFTAYRWETPPITSRNVERAFEFVLLDSPGLASHSDPAAFAEHFRGPKSQSVIDFPNLDGDAILVVPCPIGPPSAYGHLAAFLRNAPDEQKHALWSRVGAVMTHRLGATPVWLSTAGAGVSWLHVRLDNRPKYYGYRPYRELPAAS